jgi:hypothetical protein
MVSKDPKKFKGGSRNTPAHSFYNHQEQERERNASEYKKQQRKHTPEDNVLFEVGHRALSSYVKQKTSPWTMLQDALRA